MIGLLGAFGVAAAYGLVLLIVNSANILALIGMSLFLAIGLEPAVAWLTRHRFRRGLAVSIVTIVVLRSSPGSSRPRFRRWSGQIESFVHESRTTSRK